MKIMGTRNSAKPRERDTSKLLVQVKDVMPAVGVWIWALFAAGA
jgi:hypothetical protein